MQDSSALPAAPQSGVWQFGTAVLDEQRAALSVGGTEVDIDRSSYDVLLALLRHAGEVVTKEELLEAGWPGRVVSENSLAKAVSRLRQALGPQADAVRVVHGYGYRLAAAVSFQPMPGERAGTHDTAHLHEGDPLPHRPCWRLVRRLGQGSVGVTFLGRSEAGEERAIKLATSEAGLRGLKREISLARYIHAVRDDLPDVARVLDWNLSQPPFFLERTYFPEGHLADWVAGRGGLATLPLSERIALCTQLCEAVAGLHEIGLIHKDLKPENLYPCTGDDGRWRLVLADLGIGEALPSPRLAELGITMSIAAEQMPQRAGSLLYLAPEVIAGEMPTQRSDVFALGMLVYQLVVGDLRRSLAPGWEADIEDELLREDIALAAAANPERRLASARGLAGRLRRLEARRVQRAEQRAAADQRTQMQRLLERERARRPWLIATVVALLLGIAAGSFLYVKALSASRSARENAAVADAVNRFFNQDVLSAASPYSQSGKSEPTVREAIDGAVARIDERLRDQPIVEATVRMTIGQVYGEAMQIAKAIEQERRAVALFEQHLGLADPRTQRARYLLATDLTDDSRFAEAKSLIDRTDILRAEAKLTDAETNLLSHRASCYWHIRREQYDSGRAACEGVVATQLALDPKDHTALIKARANLAVLHSRAGRIAHAEDQFAKIEENFLALGDRDSPTRLRFHYLHGMNLLALKRYDEAAQALGAAHRGSIAALGADNPHTLEIEMGLAQLLTAQGRPADALPLLRHARAEYAKQLGKDSHFTAEARQALEAALCAAGQPGARDDGPGDTPSACP